MTNPDELERWREIALFDPDTARKADAISKIVHSLTIANNKRAVKYLVEILRKNISPQINGQIARGYQKHGQIPEEEIVAALQRQYDELAGLPEDLERNDPKVIANEKAMKRLARALATRNVSDEHKPSIEAIRKKLAALMVDPDKDLVHWLDRAHGAP